MSITAGHLVSGMNFTRMKGIGHDESFQASRENARLGRHYGSSIDRKRVGSRLCGRQMRRQAAGIGQQMRGVQSERQLRCQGKMRGGDQVRRVQGQVNRLQEVDDGASAPSSLA